MKMIYFMAFIISFAVFMFMITAYQSGRNDGRKEVMTKWEESIKEVEK